MTEWPAVAIMATYLVGLVFAIRATWGRPGTWDYDVGRAIGVAIWPVGFVLSFSIELVRGVKRGMKR